MDVLEKSAQLLLEKEKVTREEFEALFENQIVFKGWGNGCEICTKKIDKIRQDCEHFTLRS